MQDVLSGVSAEIRALWSEIDMTLPKFEEFAFTFGAPRAVLRVSRRERNGEYLRLSLAGHIRPLVKRSDHANEQFECHFSQLG
jgi:hypothetical protein